jgi:beta-galactosidase GanA
MQWSSYSASQQTLHDQLAALAKARNQHAATRRGTRTTLGVTTDTWVYKMDMPGDTVFVALNRGDGAQPANGLPSGSYKDLVTGTTISGNVTLSPRSALVLVPN